MAISQLGFDFEAQAVTEAPAAFQPKQGGKTAVPPIVPQSLTFGLNWATDTPAGKRAEEDRLTAEELQNPDPALVRWPQAGDIIDVIWGGRWRQARVMYTPDQSTEIFSATILDSAFGIWSGYATRRARARNPNIRKPTPWRWPKKEATTSAPGLE